MKNRLKIIFLIKSIGIKNKRNSNKNKEYQLNFYLLARKQIFSNSIFEQKSTKSAKDIGAKKNWSREWLKSTLKQFNIIFNQIK